MVGALGLRREGERRGERAVVVVAAARTRARSGSELKPKLEPPTKTR